MSNGLRQGSLLSPYLFNVYVDELNYRLSESRLGCHLAGVAANNFSYADDLAIVCPSASALNSLLRICDDFADEHYIVYSTAKSVCMCVLPSRFHLDYLPNIALSGSILEYVSCFKYLGQIISNTFKDDEDIDREIRNLCARGNSLIRKFNFCTIDVKCNLFKSFCTSLYGCSLWSRYRVATLYHLQVTYNNIMRRLAGVAPWESAVNMFVGLSVRSFGEVLRGACWSFMQRVAHSTNGLVSLCRDSDAGVVSHLRERWRQHLFVRPQM